MTEIRVLSASGQIGSGFMESSFARGIGLAPHVIGCDAGSTDAGPYYLGSGKAHFPKAGVKRDMRLMMLGRQQLGVGSVKNLGQVACSSGSDRPG